MTIGDPAAQGWALALSMLHWLQQHGHPASVSGAEHGRQLLLSLRWAEAAEAGALGQRKPHNLQQTRRQPWQPHAARCSSHANHAAHHICNQQPHECTYMPGAACHAMTEGMTEGNRTYGTLMTSSHADHEAAPARRYLALFTRRPQAQQHLHEAILQRGAVRSLLALAQGSPSAAVQEAALQVLASLTQSGQAGRCPRPEYNSSWAHARPCVAYSKVLLTVS